MPANIGDRDFIEFEGYPFTVLEAQLIAGDWTTWRVFLYDETAGTLTPLNVATKGGSRAFANPAVTNLTDPAGKPALGRQLLPALSGRRARRGRALVFYSEY